MEKIDLNPEERLNRAIKLENVDRIPCAPLIGSYAARYYGISNYEYIFDYEKAFSANASIKEDYPVWDIRRSLYEHYYGPFLIKAGLLKNKIPGIDIPAHYEQQFVEYEVMKRSDYSILIDKGYHAYAVEFFKRVHGSTEEEVNEAFEIALKIHLKEIEEAKKCQQVNLYGALMVFAPDRISLMRSFPQFIRDIYQIPDIMKEAFSIIMDFQIRDCVQRARRTGIPRVMIGLARMSGQFFSPAVFDEFIWPFLVRYVEEFLREGITPVLHLDGNWTNNLPYFLEIPKKKVILELDGETDIFLAKKVLGNHSCLLGDVPPTLLTVGTPEKVREYCLRLIREVGNGGGFIYGSGCTLPHQANRANIDAFFNCVAEYN